MQEETTHEFIKRMSDQLAALGQGNRFRRPVTAKAIANQNPPCETFKVQRVSNRRPGKAARPMRCLETNEVWPSIAACAIANGGTQNGMSAALSRAKGSPRIARFHGKHFVFDDEGCTEKI